MIYESCETGENRWMISTSGKQKPVAEIALQGGKYGFTPLRRFSKTDRAVVNSLVRGLLLEDCGEPPQGSVEAQLQETENALDACSGRLEDLGLFSELVGKMDAAAALLQEVREEMRLTRAVNRHVEAVA